MERTKCKAISNPVNPKSLITQIAVARKLMREWMFCLTGAEYKVLSFVYDRTLGWGKLQEFITLNHFIRGIDGYSEGTGLSRRSVQAAIQALEQVGAIKIARGSEGNYFSLNLEWEPGEWDYQSQND